MSNPNVKNPVIKAPTMDAPAVDITDIKLSAPPAYKVGDALATRQAYGTALVKIVENNRRVIALDGDMKNSTFSQDVRKKFPECHIECFICEQNMAGVSCAAKLS
jgi:transketolase